jgi:hypothetical protein
VFIALEPRCGVKSSPHTRQWSATFKNWPNNFPVPQLGQFDLKPRQIARVSETASYPGFMAKLGDSIES